VQHALIRDACGPLRRGSPSIAFAAYLKLCGSRLAQALDREPQDFILNLSVQHSPHEVPFRRPQMKEAFVALPGDGILGLSKIKNHGAVFNDYGIARARKKVFDGADKGFRSHGDIVSAPRYPVCDE